MNIKDLVKGKSVHFQYARKKELWYMTDDGFMFPVPFEDMGDGQFNATDKAITFMRYIRLHLKAIETETQE